MTDSSPLLGFAVAQMIDAKRALTDVVKRSSILSNDEIRQCVEAAIENIPGMDISECQNANCTRLGYRCIGWHCSKCGQPCSMMGHENCEK